MKPILIAGSILVTLALVAYSIGVITEQRKKTISWKTLIFLSIGLSLDMAGTVCMVIGSSNTMFTFHGFIGYSALLAMLIDTALMWKIKKQRGIEGQVPLIIHRYSMLVYAWWVLVYVSGFFMAMGK